MSAAAADSTQIRQVHLKGHRGPVLCLAHSSSSPSNPSSRHGGGQGGCCLLSGSEDGTARLWDLRTGVRAALCIVAPKQGAGGAEEPLEVTSVAFYPPTAVTEGSDDGTAALASTVSRNFTVYLSVDKDVYGYDLRKATSPIVRGHHHCLSNALDCQDEINQISFSHPARGGGPAASRQRLHLAAADDAGDVRVTDTVPNRASDASGGVSDGAGTEGAGASQTTNTSPRGGRQRRATSSCHVLRHVDEGSAAMATCAVFRPRAKGLDLASAGTDCVVRLWDVNRPRRPSSSFEVTRDDAGANQVCNPPMVHSLSWSPSGRLLAAALGDGTSQIFRVEGRRLVDVCRLREGHGSAVASVLFPQFGAHGSSHVAADDRLLVSAGNDGLLLLWDLGPDIAGDGAVDPSTYLRDPMALDGAGSGNSESNDDTGSAAANRTKKLEPNIMFGIPHGRKSNWLVCSDSTEVALPMTCFVSDTSCDITGYMLPH